VLKDSLKEEIIQLLQFQLQDDDKKRRLLPTGVYTRPKVAQYTGLRSQARSYEFFKQQREDELRGKDETLKVFTS
jgi:hypothetical protein